MVKYLQIALALFLLIVTVILVVMIFLRMQLPYENGIYYDPHTGGLYEESNILLLGLFFIFSITTLVVVVRLFWKEQINDFLSQKTYLKKY